MRWSPLFWLGPAITALIHLYNDSPIRKVFQGDLCGVCGRMTRGFRDPCPGHAKEAA